MLNMTGRPDTNANGTKKQKSMKEMMIDALIIGAIATAAVMGNDVPSWTEVWVMLKAFGLAFFTQLALERGLKRA